MPVYLLYGKEDFFKEQRIKGLIQKGIKPEYVDFNLDTFSGEEVESQYIIEAVNTLPVFSDYRVVIVKNAERIRSSEQKQLLSFLKKVPSYTYLVFVAGERKKSKDKGRFIISAEFDKTVKNIGKIESFDINKRDEREIIKKWIKDQAKTVGKDIDYQAIEALVNRTNRNLILLFNEIEKVSCYIGDRPNITKRDIDDLIVDTMEESIFNMMEAISDGKKDRALKILDSLLKRKERTERIIYLLIKHFRFIWQAKLLADNGIADIGRGPVPEELKLSLPEQDCILNIDNWKAKKYFNYARKMTSDEIEESFLELLNADCILKGIEEGYDDPQVVMQLLILKLCGKAVKFVH